MQHYTFERKSNVMGNILTLTISGLIKSFCHFLPTFCHYNIKVSTEEIYTFFN